MSHECLNCRYIDNCETVDQAKVLAHFVCDHHEEVSHPEQIARCDIINKFGESGLMALIKPNTKED